MSTTRLSAVESAFARLGTTEVPFVFACVIELDRPVAVSALRARVSAAVVDMPRYRQRLRRGVLHDDWVDAPFSAELHVRAAMVDDPGGPPELDRLAAELLSREALPDNESPWCLWVVGGLPGGRRAVIAVVHHALVDGISGFRALTQLVGGATAASPETASPRLAHGDTTGSLVKLARLLRDGVVVAPDVGLNPRRTSATRAIASLTVELEACREIGRELDATTNDVVLATVAGGLRAYLLGRAAPPHELRGVRAMVPVSRHVPGERDTAGNRVALLVVGLPLEVADPAARLAGIHATMQQLKRGGAAAGGDLLVALAEATTPALLSTVLRVALWRRAFNLIVTNVPGPDRVMRFLGATVTRIVPIVNLWPGQSLGIAAASYAGKLTFSVHADACVIPDADRLRDELAAAFRELREVARTRAMMTAHLNTTTFN